MLDSVTVTLCSKRDFVYVIRLKFFVSGSYLYYVNGLNYYNHFSLYKDTGRGRVKCDDESRVRHDALQSLLFYLVSPREMFMDESQG